MKTINLLVLSLLLSIGTSYAQSFDIRAYTGMNILQLSSDNGTTLLNGVLHHKTVSGRPGYQFGAALTFGERFYVQPGIQYTTLSTKITNANTVTGTEFTDETSLKIFSIPLKAGIRLIDPKTENIFNVRLFGGLDGYHILSVNHSDNSGNLDEITTDDYSNLIVNADFGIGVDILFFYLDMGYQIGLSPVHSGSDKAKANSFYSNIGLRLRF